MRVFLPPARSRPADVLAYVCAHLPLRNGEQLGGNCQIDRMQRALADRPTHEEHQVLGIEPSTYGAGWFLWLASEKVADSQRLPHNREPYATLYEDLEGPVTYVYLQTGRIWQSLSDGTWEELQPLWGVEPTDPWEWQS